VGMVDGGLLALLNPLWQAVLGVCVALAVIVASWRLFGRGPSRMSRGLVTAAVALLLVLMVSLVIASWSAPR